MVSLTFLKEMSSRILYGFYTDGTNSSVFIQVQFVFLYKTQIVPLFHRQSETHHIYLLIVSLSSVCYYIRVLHHSKLPTIHRVYVY